ncbi:MAG: UDP-N-acetylglucosamine--N-acetylmuramyl-(pentapeptide) pyrophosphoryl-undecaprenol N-acetylglucosamine transferase, partial [Clostridia bacterium]|nr:UDP-N-acetylglucosamine--N-acetylmuramyl-(pentapeptide) pyrophosphoryl-undecaprenol N-acetylglucosamine transferase [Clostridia bacterium]
MRILFTGGGTCGHLTPAIAMADAVRENIKGAEILFIGRRGGEENKLVVSAGYELKEVDIKGLSRESKIKQVGDSLRSCRAVFEAGGIIREFRPDLTVGTGGYASFPALAYSTLKHIPTVIHESNAYPGLVTRLFAKRARLVLLGLEGAREHLPSRARVRVVGNPARGDFDKIKRSEARASLGATEKIMILSVGGSGGAKSLNEAAIGLMRGYSKKRKDILHIHVTGRAYYESVTKSTAEITNGSPNLKIVPFIEDMPRYIRAADIVISRCGAMTVSELLHVGCPAILIPSPNVTDDHQMKNALEAKRVADAVV